MSSHIWWGMRTEIARRGLVADACPSCRTVTCFVVWDHFAVFHLFQIGMGETHFVESTRSCFMCQEQVAFDENAYGDVLSMAEVSSLSIEAGIRRTHLRLGSLLLLVDRLKSLRSGPASPSSSEEPRDDLDGAIWWLERLIYRGADIGALAQSIERWEQLTETERELTVDALRKVGRSHGLQRE